MADLADAGEVLGYVIRFWGAVFRRSYREQLASAWTRAGAGARTWMVLEGATATVLGLGVPAILVWLIGAALR